MPTPDRILKTLSFPIQYLEIGESVSRAMGRDPDLLYQHCGMTAPRPFMPWQTLNGKQLKLSLEFFLEQGPMESPPLVTFLQHFPMTTNGPLGMLAITSETLGDALQGAIRYAPLVMPAFTMRRVDLKDEVHTVVEGLHDFGEVNDFLTEVVVVSLLKIMPFLTRPLSGGEVHLKHAPQVNPKEYESAFGVKFVFNARRNQIVLRKSDMAIPLISRSKASYLLMKATLDQHSKLNLAVKPVSTEVKRHLHAALQERKMIDASALCEAMSLSPRTFSRKLKEEGYTLPKLRAEVGLEYAEVLLLETDEPISQVAMSAGFSDATAFARAFRRSTGQSPSAWRAREHTLDQSSAKDSHPPPRSEVSKRRVKLASAAKA